MNDLTPFTTKPDDWATDQEVRWCPGCGDYAILKAVQRTMPELGVRPENTVFVSGIGCSSRFPYYMETYGFHTIHGRAPAIATGIKLANPELDVWIVTGDGDGLSIGGNHMLHLLRRNLDCQLLLFNNEIYGLTKGQYSPTSRAGTRTPSSPTGSLDRPLSPSAFALGAGARFVARTIDTAQKHMPDLLKRAHAHKGASFVEIFQNCIVYNDGVFDEFTGKQAAATRQLLLEHGAPMLYANGRRGLAIHPQTLALHIVDTGDMPADEAARAVLTHDETSLALATLLATMPETLPLAAAGELPAADAATEPAPVPLGVLYHNPAPTLDAAVTAQRNAIEPLTDLNALLRRGQSWVVPAH